MKYRKKVHERYHEATSIQRKVVRDNNFTYRIIISFLNKYIDSKGMKKKILDIGCGAGTMSLYLANKGHDITGIDISSKAVSSAARSAKLMKLKNIKFKVIDFPAQVPNETYDFVVITEVIEHLQDDNLALTRINKLLNKDGLLLLSTPSKNAPLYKLGFADEFDKRVGHVRRYGRSDLKKMFTKNGFEIIEFKATEGIVRNSLYVNPLAGRIVRYIKFYLSDIVTHIDNIFLKLFGASNYFVVARKLK